MITRARLRVSGLPAAVACFVAALGASIFWITTGAHAAARPSTVRSVSLFDTSGRPLQSLFAGLPVDPRFAEFKRLVTDLANRPHCGRPRSALARLSEAAGQFARRLGISADFVVHA